MEHHEGVDHYLQEGCGRCKYGGTPQCKVHTWTDELKAIRSILEQTGLTEEIKWKVPCYTWHGKNILILAAFKEYVSVSFFKGVLLDDPEQLLQSPGEQTQSARLIKWTSISEVDRHAAYLKVLVEQAIELEEKGQKVTYTTNNKQLIPEELKAVFATSKELKVAFEALTPGRQRGYLLYFSQAKQSGTRASRIKQHIPRILQGLGLQD